MRRFIFPLTLLTLAIATGVAWIQHRTLTQANFRIAQLEREIRVTKAASTKAIRPSDPVPSLRSHDSIATAATPVPAAKPIQSLTEWRVEQELEEIEKFTTLTDTQRESLKSAVAAELANRTNLSGSLDAEARQRAISAVLGSEMATQLESDLKREQEEAELRELDNETYSLSRKLQLSAEQEEHLRSALAFTQALLKTDRKLLNEKMSDAMAQHFDGDPERAQLREAYQEIKLLSEQIDNKKYSALAEQLSGVLSEQQLTTLLNDNATK